MSDSGAARATTGADKSVLQAATAPRVMVVWCPDWPVVAAVAAEELSIDDPVAVVAANEVLACSARARLDGVRRGMRRRDAVARCPELVCVEANEARDLRAFELVLSGLEQLVATVTPIRAGICAVPVPSRFYGGEPQAAAVIAEMLVEYGVWDCRVGIADGLFAAEQAARRPDAQSWFLVSPNGSARFLADLEIGALEDAELVSLLRRLGIRRLGEFAALSSRDVSTRFGRPGTWLHRLCRGEDFRVAAGRRPPIELTQRVAFEPPLETVEPIVFSTRQTADRFVAELARHGLVATSVTIEVHGDRGWRGVRTWGHPRWFGSADLVDRVYWQLQADPAPEPVGEVRLVPEAVESLGDHGDGLWGSATDDQVERGVARLQGMLGPEAVIAPTVQGGRGAVQRQTAVPWGERADGLRPRSLPWPGSIPPPAPTRVFPRPRPAVVLGHDDRPVAVSDRGLVVGEPTRFRPDPTGTLLGVQAWAGPWPIDELWWDPDGARQVARFQLVGVDGSAWLLLVEQGQWWTEARYD
ncbi:MAG: DNA polymerase Y family protein [Microlunatus sp.]|nr:DNA polymerase Y family protein [Microlunatus sp.]